MENDDVKEANISGALLRQPFNQVSRAWGQLIPSQSHCSSGSGPCYWRGMVSKSTSPEPEGLDGSGVITKVYTPAGKVLRAAHPDYSDMPIKPGQDFAIWGVVQWNVHKV